MLPVNYLAVLVATAAAMIIGSVWYAPFAFGKTWMKLVGMTPEKARKSDFSAFVGMTVAAALTAYVLAHFIYFSAASGLFPDMTPPTNGLATAFWAWLGFVATTLIAGPLFAKTSWKLFFINVGNQLVTLLAMGAIIGAWQ